MPQVMPFVPSVSNYRFTTTLADDLFIFDVRWNARDAAWYFDILDEDQLLIRAGIKIMLGAPIGARVADDRFPTGLFQAVDTSQSGTDATYDDLGVRVVVYFYTNAELSAA